MINILQTFRVCKYSIKRSCHCKIIIRAVHLKCTNIQNKEISPLEMNNDIVESSLELNVIPSYLSIYLVT